MGPGMKMRKMSEEQEKERIYSLYLSEDPLTW